MYLIINEINECTEKSNGNNYIRLVPVNKHEYTLKKYGELWTKMIDLISSKTDNSDEFDKKYLKIKLNSDDDLPLNKTRNVEER